MTRLSVEGRREDDGTAAPGPGPGPRVASIDLLRGIVMVVMVLDHVRDYFGDPRVDPTDLASTTPALFATRWVTHFCAPTFLLLAGVGASLSGAGRTKGGLSRHLVARGLWLIFLEQTWGNVGIFFTYPHVVLALVLWAIGWSMIALAALIHLPRAVVGGIGLALIALHDLADGVQVADGPAATLWGFLHEPGLRRLPGGVPVLIGYPLIPWVGVMAVGYALGPLFLGPAGPRKRALLGWGLGSVVGFVAIRWLNVYGDPRPWSVGPGAIASAMSFLNCGKYPPSLLYLMMTLGPALLALAALDRGMGRAGRPLQVFGRVPLFFYLWQWPVAHGLAVALAASRGEPIGWMFRFPPFRSPPGYGHGLGTVYLAWVVTLGLLYPACLRHSRRGRPRRDPA